MIFSQRCIECGHVFKHPLTFCVKCLGRRKNEPRYDIIRRWKASGKKTVILRSVTLAVAMAHCDDPRVKKAGAWFDRYEAA